MTDVFVICTIPDHCGHDVIEKIVSCLDYAELVKEELEKKYDFVYIRRYDLD